MNRRFDFITDPDDPNIPLNDLLSKIEFNEAHLDRGLVRYTANKTFENPDELKTIETLIGEIAYVPVTVTVNLNKFEDYELIGNVITGAKEIIKVFTEKILKVVISDVESVKRDNIMIFNPISNNSIYENAYYLGDYHTVVDMNKLGGYQVLSASSLTKYVLSEIYEEGPEDLNIIYIEDIALIPVGRNDNEINYYTKISDRINSIITKKEQDGYFSYKIGVHNLEDLELVHDLARLWNTNVVYDTDLSNIVMRSDVDFGIIPEEWFRYNVNLIRYGQFPQITLYGSWQFNFGGDYNEIFGKINQKALLHYGALLSYRKLDSFVHPFAHTVKVNDDLSITLSLPTYKHVSEFKDNFNDIIIGFLGISDISDQTWFSQPVTDLIDGAVKRYYVQSIDNKALPMILPQNGEEILVFRSPTIISYPDPYDFSKVKWESVKTKLVNDLRSYYKVCHDGIEPVLLESIDTMELSELLELIEIQENRGPTYCFTKSTILKLTKPINPLTRRPFSEHVLIKAMMMEWGIRGLFNVGPLLGLYPNVPAREMIKPIGNPIVYKLDIDEVQYNFTGDIYNVEIGFKDGTVSPLFEIATEKENELKATMDRIWPTGYFLNYWASAVQKYSDPTSYPVIVNKDIFIYAGDSKPDGEMAMQFLHQLSNNL